jgi:hypothetical protein
MSIVFFLFVIVVFFGIDPCDFLLPSVAHCLEGWVDLQAWFVTPGQNYDPVLEHHSLGYFVVRRIVLVRDVGLPAHDSKTSRHYFIPTKEITATMIEMTQVTMPIPATSYLLG